MWIRDGINGTRMSAAGKVLHWQAPEDGPAEHFHYTQMPCIVWIGESPARKGLCYGDNQPMWNRTTLYGRPASSNHHGAGYG